ncbi:uncharacterized protein I206_106673 [Kwoniella pini CBS 10737]|uniref:EVE domain-containing protein n=1 Tax=Kwoniella pini CBS 10737 TaxID=1296096 RepID=A0A1B9HTJ0_9TREE|nr:uncharacterized protein I206_07437 [Kwoniella pini CBS 10737]OCF46584.1 hypothetical protein I206_07437 [Kwoniella pini CBS 10737]
MPWLMKAEPDSRIIKGKDVKFSVDDFEKLGVSPWDGVRNHEAKKIMKERMKLGDKVLFYHSNCKTPGVYAIAEIVKEGYPDYTAWDSDHPYFDIKTNKENPTWFMVNVKFIERLKYPPTLLLIKTLSSLSSLSSSSSSLPIEIDYISKKELESLKSMQLVNRGRLSVQPVEQIAFDTIIKLGTKGGWDGLIDIKGKGKSKLNSITNSPQKKKRDLSIEIDGQNQVKEVISKKKPTSNDKKTKTEIEISKTNKNNKAIPSEGIRRSKRIKVD